MIEVSTDKSRLDISFIYNFLKNTYWAKDRSLELVKTSIENSLCFGIYLNKQQIGFARVITDFVSIGYPMDVFITDEHKGNGYASILMEAVMNEPLLQNIKIWGVATLDAHYLYKKFGFTEVTNTEKLLEKIIV